MNSEDENNEWVSGIRIFINVKKLEHNRFGIAYIIYYNKLYCFVLDFLCMILFG